MRKKKQIKYQPRIHLQLGRRLSFLMIVVLSLSVSFTRMGVVHAETQEKNAENKGVHFYHDEACTKRVLETRNAGTKYTRTYTRIQLPRNGGKVYMRMKDSKDIKYRPDKEKVIRVTDKFTMDADGKADMPGFVTVKPLADSVEGDAIYEITIANPDNHDMLYLNPVVAYEDDEYDLVNPWIKSYEYLRTDDDKDDDDDDSYLDERLDVDILYVDFVDEGLNISDPWDVSYMHAWDYYSCDENNQRDDSSWYPGEERLYQNPGAADFGAGFGFSTPFETRPACFLLQENGVSTLLDDASKLTVYEEDGVTVSQRVSVESCRKFNKKSLEGEMILRASPDVVGRFIIRYTDGKKNYDLPYMIGLPTVGLYTAPERSLEKLAGQVAQKNEKKHTYYLLSDHPMAWENIVIQHGCGNSYCKNRTNWEMIEDVSDGQRLYGFKIRVKPDEDEPYLLHFSERNERGQVMGDSAYTFFYTTAPEVGEQLELGYEVFEVIEQAGAYGTTGSVRAVKVIKRSEYLVLDGYEHQYARNYRVTEIGPSFSANNKKLGYLWLSALKIGKNAFMGCTKLKEIEFWEDNVLKIKFGKNAFKGVPSSAIAIIDEVNKKTLNTFTRRLRKAGFKGKVKQRMWTDEWGYDLI